MGRKARKTRWRTLAIADESDSEESNTLSGSQVSKSYNHRQFYSKFTYSSQSTPTRRFPYEPKSTRSSSTASENKITFNEDEYTKITTPRQDVLFKKGYLSKPKNYQTQTSTGNSTASTGNSTGNGTPDHQSADGTEGTDLEYESQFVFPNAFVDQNGIYYINGYEHYPLVMYNPPICYPEYPLSRTKRHSTGSLTESASPHTEEASQDLNQSGGENTGNGPEFNQVYNVVYPGYYFNGVCSPNATTNGQAATEPRKIKKKRRRKISKSLNQEETTSSEDGYSSDEAITQVENRVQNPKELRTNGHQQSEERAENAEAVAEKPENPENEIREEKDADEDSGTIDPVGDSLNENDVKDTDCSVSSKEGNAEDESGSSTQNVVVITEVRENPTKESRFNLNAEEFVPRAYRPLDQAMPLDPNLQFINIHPNFVPLPLINHPLNELNPPPFNPSFLPPGIPINFVPADPKLLPNFVNFVPNHFVPSRKNYEQPQNAQGKVEEVKNKEEKIETREKEEIVEETSDSKQAEEEVKEPERIDGEKLKNLMGKNDVDIAKIVSKLEEAAKEQKLYENRRQNYRSPNKLNKGFRPRFNSPYQNEQGRQPYDKRRPRRFETIDSKSSPTREEEGTATVQAKPEETQTEQQTKTEPKEPPKEEEQKFSPRHHNYKNPNSPRKYVNCIGRNFKGRTAAFQQIHSLSSAEFSDTSKRSTSYSKSCPRFEKYASNRLGGTVDKIIVSKKPDESAREIPKSPLANKTSQWISVSNKKKRKNKSTNDDEAEVPDDNPEIQAGQVQIEIPPQSSPIQTELDEESSKIGDIIEMIAKSEAIASKPIDIPDSQIQHVTDIEKALLEESEKMRGDHEEEDITAKDSTPPKPNESLQVQSKVTKEGAKKKAKKGNVKAPATKRIIILDPDTSKDKNETNTSNKIEKIVEIPDELVDAKPEISEDAPLKEPPVSTAAVQETEVATKKSKKKKKPAKSNLSTSLSSISSSSTNLNQIDDSYDFLLDTTVLIDDKTNIEVSEELDKMIQKGLFGNLEEKFRSLNVSVDDDFFKSLSLKPKTQSTPEKGFIKATNFTTILNNANNQSLTKVKAGDDSHKMAKLQEHEPQPSTSKTGNFLEKTVESETGPSIEVGQLITKTKGNGRLRNKSKKNVASDGGKIADDGSGSKKGGADGESGEEILLGRHIKVNFEDAKGDKNGKAKLDEGILTGTTEEASGIKEDGPKIYTRDEVAKLVKGYPLQKDSGKFTPTNTDHNVKIDVALAPNDGAPAANPTDDDDLKLDNNFLKNADFSPSPPSKEERVVVKIEESAKLDGENTRNAFELKPLYPITQAVKDWMTKTRETTPDIEILKSPDTIYKEFIEDDRDDDSDTETNQKNAISNPSPIDYFDQQEICHYSMGARVATARTDVEDDLTICETWSMSQDTSLQDDADLLDCWEPEIGEAAAKKEEIPIEQAEDVLQLVENDFGNDEFLRLKAEVEEQKKNGTFPKHGNLPYRAICCSLM